MKYFAIKDGGIHWKPFKLGNRVEYEYYFYPTPNWLEPKYRYLGYAWAYYDGYHYSFGFWYFNITWNVGLKDIKSWIWNQDDYKQQGSFCIY